MKSVAELKNFLRSWLPDLRRQRNFSAVVEVQALQAITHEVGAAQSKAAQAAYTAEQADLDAAAILERAAADGLDASDLPAVRQAIKQINRSARHDHTITEVLA